MKTITLTPDGGLASELEALPENKKSVLPDGTKVFEPLTNVSVVSTSEGAEARIFSAYECGAAFAPFHFVRDCLQKKAEAAVFVNRFSDAALLVPEPADTRAGLGLLEADAGRVPDAGRLTEAARKAGFSGDFPDFEKKFVCKKSLLSQGLSVRFVKNRRLTAFVRFRGGERGVSALCGLTRGDPAAAPLEGKETLFFDALYFPDGEGDPALAFGYSLLEDRAAVSEPAKARSAFSRSKPEGELRRFSRRIRPELSPIPAHLAAALFWGLIGGAILAPFALPPAVKAIPLALALLFSAARLIALTLSVKR